MKKCRSVLEFVSLNILSICDDPGHHGTMLRYGEWGHGINPTLHSPAEEDWESQSLDGKPRLHPSDKVQQK